MSSQWPSPEIDPLYPVAAIARPLTRTQPTCFLSQVARVETAVAICRKYASQSGRTFEFSLGRSVHKVFDLLPSSLRILKGLRSKVHQVLHVLVVRIGDACS